MKRTLLALLCLPTLAAAQTYALKRTPKVGDTTKYRVTIVFNIYGSDVFYTSIDTQKITNVAKDGSYTVESTQSDIRATNAGQEMKIVPSDKASVTTYNARGQVIQIQGQQAADPWRIADLSSFISPEKPLAKGDSWTYTIPPRAEPQTPGGTFTYSFEGPEPELVDEVSALRVAEDYKENTQFNKATSTGTIFIDPQNGEIIKLDETWHAAPILGVATLVNGHVSYERIR